MGRRGIGLSVTLLTGLGMLLSACGKPALSGEERMIGDSIASYVALEHFVDQHPAALVPQLQSGWMASGFKVEFDSYRVEVHYPVNDEFRIMLVCVGRSQVELGPRCNADSPPHELGDGWYWVSAPVDGPVISFAHDTSSIHRGLVRFSEVTTDVAS